MLDTAEPRYGAPTSGLICAYLFSPGEIGHPIETDDALNLVASHVTGAADTFLWLHFNLANQASQRWLQQHLSPPEEFQTAFAGGSPARVELAESSIVAVLNDVRLFGLDPSNVSTMSLWVAGRLLVSARHTPLRSVERLRQAVMRGAAFQSPVELLSHLLRDQAAVLAQIIREFTTEIDRIEDGVLQRRIESTRWRLGELRRTLVRLQRWLAPEPVALARLLKKPPVWMAAADVDALTEAADEFASALVDGAALNDRIRLLQEELSALLNEQTNRTVFVLTTVTVIALPMTIVSGFLGMNVSGVPLQHGEGFWIAVWLVCAISAVVALVAFRGSRAPRRRKDSGQVRS